MSITTFTKRYGSEHKNEQISQAFKCDSSKVESDFSSIPNLVAFVSRENYKICFVFGFVSNWFICRYGVANSEMSITKVKSIIFFHIKIDAFIVFLNRCFFLKIQSEEEGEEDVGKKQNWNGFST